MDHSILKQHLETIQTWRARENYQRALQHLNEAVSQGAEGPEITAQRVGIGFILDDWQPALDRLLNELENYPLGVLCGGANTLGFTRLVHEYSGFRTMLLEHLLLKQRFDGFRDWISISEKTDQQWLIKHWHQTALDAADPDKAVRLYVATGVGLFTIGDWDGAWRCWTSALKRNPFFLQPISALCKASPKMDLSRPDHRLRLIHLIAVAGKKKESMSLLQALALENKANALQIFNNMPSFIPYSPKSKEVALLRFNIAMYLEKPELMIKAVGEMDHLNEDDLFNVKKRVRMNVKDAFLRHSLMMEFARVYIRKEEWENAAMLLETLYQEDGQLEIIRLMEKVTDHYPILSQLHFIIGKYYLENGKVEQAVKRFEIVSDVQEYQTQIRELLENILTETYQRDLVKSLIKLHPPDSHKACMLALLIVLKEGAKAADFLVELGDWSHRKEPSPFWYLALIHGYLTTGSYGAAIPLMIKFLRNYSGLSPELIKPTQLLVNKYKGDFGPFIQLLETLGNILKPKDQWAIIKKAMVEAAQKNRVTGAKGATGPTGPVRKMVQREPLKPLPESSKRAPAVEAQPAVGSSDLGPVLPKMPPPSSPIPADPLEDGGPLQGASLSEFESDLDLDATLDGKMLPLPSPVVKPEKRSTAKKDLPAPGEIRVGGKIVQSLKSLSPDQAKRVLIQLEQWANNHPTDIKWTLNLLKLFLEAEAWDKVIFTCQKAVKNPHFREGVAAVFHYMAQAYEAQKKDDEAFRFYCLAARNLGYYKEKKDWLISNVFPKHEAHLRELLQQVLIHEDRESWEVLLTQWHKKRPDQLPNLLKAQKAFTAKAKSPETMLDLAFWHLQAGRINEVAPILDQIDLTNPDIRDSLVHVTNLASLKYPDDPKPRFVLARYYLVQHDVAQAITIFRNMAKSSPGSADPIFKYIHTYLKKKPADVDNVYLYGLLIRFTLSYGTPMNAVKLLDEFGRIDQEGALSLTDGVFRVIMGKEDALEVVYELARLHWQWRAYKKMLDINASGELGTHMAHERLKWLKDCQSRPELRDRAILAAADLHMQVSQFNNAREALSSLRDFRYRKQTLPLYETLTKRFPDKLDIWQEAAWAIYAVDREKALPYFRKLYEGDELDFRVEAFAVLNELGEKPDFADLAVVFDNEDRLYDQLLTVGGKIRDMELAAWQGDEDPPPIKSLEWLLFTGQLDRYRQFQSRIKGLPESVRKPLDARYDRAVGRFSPAAWQMEQCNVPTAVKQSYFCDAGMPERAVYIKEPKSRLPQFIRDSFILAQGGPQSLAVHFSQLRILQREHVAPKNPVLIGKEGL